MRLFWLTFGQITLKPPCEEALSDMKNDESSDGCVINYCAVSSPPSVSGLEFIKCHTFRGKRKVKLGTSTKLIGEGIRPTVFAALKGVQIGLQKRCGDKMPLIGCVLSVR